MFRFNEEKDPLLWIRAPRWSPQSGTDVFFLLLGGVHWSNKCTSRKVARAADRLVTARYGERMRPWRFASMDVFLLTSRYEGTPNVAIEAQWLGVPVVSTPAGGTEETLDEANGWIVRKRDPRAIASQVIRSRPAESAASARERPVVAHERFGIERMIDETLDVYGYTAGARFGRTPKATRRSSRHPMLPSHTRDHDSIAALSIPK